MSWLPEPAATTSPAEAPPRTEEWSAPAAPRPWQPAAAQVPQPQPYAPSAHAPQPYAQQPYAGQPHAQQPHAPQPYAPQPQLDPRFQPYGQAPPQLDPRFQPYGQAPPAPSYGQPYPHPQAYPQPHPQAYPQAYPQPYGHQPFGRTAGQYGSGGLVGLTGPRPIAHHAASRALLTVALFIMGLSVLRFIGASDASYGNPYYSQTLATAQVVSFLGALAVLTLTILGRRRADQGEGSLLRIAGVAAVTLGALSIVSLLTIITTGRGIGVAGGVSMLMAGIHTLRATSD